MNEQQAQELLQRYRQGLCPEEESKAIEDWIAQEQRSGSWDIPDFEKQLFGQALKASIDRAIGIKESDPFKNMAASFSKKSAFSWPRYAIAASVLFCLSIGGYFLFNQVHRIDPLTISRYRYIRPGGYKATLILSGGQKVELTGARYGVLASDGSATIHKTGDGAVGYDLQRGAATAPGVTIYNTITTPRGGQYKVTLSDGTLVWLNSASSIHFPTAFSGRNRAVSITGEAYFEVAHNPHQPFVVSTSGQQVEVLGTHFNINSYTDEKETRTALLQGSVSVSSGDRRVLIKPGQQAILDNHIRSLDISAADLEKAVAWTNGNFVFDHDNIQTVMRQISRWYDIDVVYEGAMAHKDFVGSVSRFDNVAEVLNTLQLTGTVHFKIEGRRVTVTAD